MSGIGENLLCELVAQVVFKSITIARHIVNDSRVFVHEKHNFQVRLNVQIGRLEEVQKFLNNRALNEEIQPRDRHTYFHVTQKIHGLLLSYFIETESDTDEALKFVRENSADELYKKIELSDPMLSSPSLAQEKFWLRAKETVRWVLFKKKSVEKLVLGVEEWGNCLAALISTTLPLIFLRKQLTAAEIARYTPNDNLGDTIIKSKILIEKRVEEEAVASSMSGLKISSLDPIPSDLKYSQLEFLTPDIPSAKNIKEGDEKDQARTDLGGASRRKWAQLFDERGYPKEARVIVEFKERPQGNAFHDQGNVDYVKKELKSLVRELRLGASGETFRVLYCHGFYEHMDHYGLVYQLPRSLTDEGYLHCESLGNILMHTEYKLRLGDDLQNRLELAKSLAKTIYHLHSVQWVHKSFNPDNILIFSIKDDKNNALFNWSRPYVVGFDASRANRGHSDKLPTSLRWENRVYTHPDRQREGELPRFHKSFDIYSLGVVLLEIGMLECFKHSSYRRSPKWTDIPAREVQNRFIDCAKDLRRELGKTYSEIVKVCLDGDFGILPKDDDADETRLLDAFRSEVVEKFDQVRY